MLAATEEAGACRHMAAGTLLGFMRGRGGVGSEWLLPGCTLAQRLGLVRLGSLDEFRVSDGFRFSSIFDGFRVFRISGRPLGSTVLLPKSSSLDLRCDAPRRSETRGRAP